MLPKRQIISTSLGRKFLTVAFILSMVVGSFGQSLTWDWVKSNGGWNNDEGWAISNDSIGNSYVVGTFISDSITFGSTLLINNSVYAMIKYRDIFIAKYDTNGNILWAKKIGGNYDDYSYSATSDASGNIYLTGYFAGSISFGTVTLFGVGFKDVFIAKYDTNGNLLWAKSAGSTDDDEGEGIAVDNTGNIYLTGFFQSPTITFGSTTLTNTTSSYYIDLFVVKYNSNGNVLWARKAGGTKHDYGTSICTDAFNNVFVAGYFYSPTITFATSTLTNSTLLNMFIAKYTNSGTLLWVKNLGNGYSNDIAANNSGEIFTTGIITTTPVILGTDTLIGEGGYDMFVAKFDTGGNPIWARSGGGTASDIGNALTVDELSNVYVTGSYQSHFIYFPNDTLVNSDTSISSDIYIVSYDNSGNLRWSKGIRGHLNQMESASSISIFSGDVYLTGYFYSDTLTFDSFYLVNDTSYGSTDIFIAKLNQSITTGLQLESFSSDNSFHIFPNPTSGQITISNTDNFDKIIVTDLLGQIVFQKELKNNDFSLHIENSGIYFITLLSNKRATTKKLVVQR